MADWELNILGQWPGLREGQGPLGMEMSDQNV